MGECEDDAGARALFAGEAYVQSHGSAQARYQVKAHARGRTMGAADLAGESALEDAGHVGGGDAAAVVAHFKHRAAARGARLLFAGGEDEGARAVFRCVGDYLP